MKLHIVPVENECNATCPCCITKFKKETGFGKHLDVNHLEKIKDLDIDEIEITGPGEPFLHKRIAEIISLCISKAPTQVYTNGSLVIQKGARLRKLMYLCLSRMHHEDKKNIKLMNVRYKIVDLQKLFVPIKLSVVLMKGGIDNARDLRKYFSWANDEVMAKKVVVRQMSDFEYPSDIQKRFVSLKQIFDDLSIADYHHDEQGNIIFRSKKMEVEFETKTCETEHLVMRANGKIYKGWTNIEAD